MIDGKVKRELLKQKVALWRNTKYDAQVDVQVADAIGDEELKKQATERIKSAIKAIDALGKLLGELEKANDSNNNEA